MGRVITGRGDVFNYKRGEMSRGMETVKPYDYGKLMTNIHRGAIITEKAMKSPLGAAGSPLITAPKAAYGALKAGGKWAGEQLGLRDPDPLSEAARVKAMAQGKVLPKPPVAAPVPGTPGGVQVKQPATMELPIAGIKPVSEPPVIRADGTRSLVDNQLIQLQWSKPSSHPLVVNLRNAANERNRLKDLNDGSYSALENNISAKFGEANSAYLQAMQAMRTAGLDADSFLAGVGPSQHEPTPTPTATPTAAPTAALGMPVAQPPGGLPEVGPETAALWRGKDTERQIAFKLRKAAHDHAVATEARKTASVTAQDVRTTRGLKGQALLDHPAFASKIYSIAAKGGWDPNELAAVLGVESSINPYVPSPKGSSATGIFQIIEKVAAELGTTTTLVRQMDPMQQLDLFAEYLTRKGATKGNIDMAVFAPAAIGKPDDWTIPLSKAGVAANLTMDFDDSGTIEAGERRQWARDQAQRQPFALGERPEVPGALPMPPEPTLAEISPSDLVEQRQQVDVGAVVVPGVRPQSVNYGNLLVMARNADGDAQKNWVRQLVLEDDTKLPWSNLGDLFTGAYKTRAAKAVEDAFAKEMDPLKKAKIGYYDASAERAKRPAVARAKARSRSHGKKTPKVWVRVLDDLKSKRTRLLDQADDLRKAMRAVTTQSISAFEGTSPIQKSAESTEDFDKRTEIWQNKVTEMETSRTVGRGNKIADLQSQLDKVDNALRRVDRTYQNGIDLSTSSPNAIPRAWNERRHSMFNELDFGPAPQEWGGGRAPAKASAKPPAKPPAETPTTTTKPGSTGNSGLGGLAAPPG